MATIDYVIFEHHLKSDGTYNIKFRVTHKKKQVYKASTYHVTSKQLKKDFTLRDTTVLDSVNAKLAEYRKTLNLIVTDIEDKTAAQVRDMIFATGANKGYIDFLEFGDAYIERIKKQGRETTYDPYFSVFKTFKLFIGEPTFNIINLSSSTLKEFEAFLLKGWTFKRLGKEYQSEGLNISGVKYYMTVIRAIFNACKEQYNTEYLTLIPNSPFSFYKMPKGTAPRKRGGDLTVEMLREFRDKVLPDGQSLCRDIFMLSFYLCGTNAMDIYKQDWKIVDGRLEFERSKTRVKRKDSAFISIKIPNEAKPLLSKLTKEFLQGRYKSFRIMVNSIGMSLPEGITFYHARHTFATLAYNVCGFSKDHIAMALNHVDNSRVTDRYIATDWSIIDRVQEGVLSLLTTDKPI